MFAARCLRFVARWVRARSQVSPSFLRSEMFCSFLLRSGEELDDEVGVRTGEEVDDDDDDADDVKYDSLGGSVDSFGEGPSREAFCWSERE